MIDFMLYDSSSELSQFHGIRYSFLIEKFYLDPCPAFYITTFSWNREASFFITTELMRMFDNFGINESYGFKIFIVIIPHKRYNNNSLIHSYLRGCESHATIICIFYMLEHILYEFAIS